MRLHTRAPAAPSANRTQGFTVVEAVFSLAVFTILLAGVVSTFLGVQRGVDENLSLDQLRQKTHFSVQRLTDLVAQASTEDPEFQLFAPDATSGFHALEFRLLSSVAGGINYDNAHVFVLGPDSAAYTATGIVVGRAPDLATVTAEAGTDGELGTIDDDFAETLASGEAVVELLIASDYAPRVAPMLRLDVNDRVVEITVRTNFQRADGTWLLPDDFVIRERVALRQ